MSTLLPEKWGESLERVHDKGGYFLSKLNPLKKYVQTQERIAADTLPAFMQFGGPSLDMREISDELIIRAEVLGLKKDDFSIELVGRRLTITGEKNVVCERKGGDGRLISECRYGSFSRTVQLTYETDEKTISADLEHGILTIRLPKPDKDRQTRYRVPVS